MSTVLVVLHVFVCIFLIAVVLLQRGKGAEIGAVFGGGGSSTVFGSRGAGNFLTKLTTASAVIFMLTRLGLSYIWSGASSDRLFQEGVDEPAPAAEERLFEEIETVPAPAAEAESLEEIETLPAPAADEGTLPALPEPEPAEPTP
jgi:preprotein translocase subunit SecG